METFIYITKSIAILSIFYIIYRIVLQKDTFFTANRHYLLSGIIAALVLPFLEYTKTIYQDIPNIPITTATDSYFIPATIETIPHQESIAIDWWQVSLLLYGIGIFVMITRLTIQLVSLNRLINKYPKTYKDGYTYVEITDKSMTPFSFFKTICYNPKAHSSEELEMILAHEKIHVSQWHTFDVLLTQCVLAIQWLNPFAWLYKKSLEQNLEFIADNGAIQRVPSSLEYQRTLVKVSSTIAQPALTNNFYHSLIKKRIVMLNKQTSSRRNLWKLGLVLPALAIFMYSFNIKEVVKYREASNELIENNIAFTDVDSKENKKFYINTETTASQLDAIENHFTTYYPEKRIKFDNRVFHENGHIKQFSFQTKFPSEERFYTRFDRPTINDDWAGYQITDTDKTSIQVKELGDNGVTFKITKEKLVFSDNIAKQNPVFVINDETSDSDLTTIETFFEMYYPDANIKIDNVERDTNGALTHYTVRTIFDDAKNGGDNIFENNTQNIKEGTSIHYEEGPAIIVKQLGDNGLGLKSTPNGLESSNLTTITDNLTYETQLLQQATQNNTNTGSENIQSTITGLQDATDNLSQEVNDITNVLESQSVSEVIKESNLIAKDVRILITKNTSEKELKALKKELKKDHNLNLNYSTSRNSSDQITSINISYSGNNKTGTYNISGDEPIEDFYFYMKEDGDSGFWSESHERRLKERRLHLEERREEMQEHREQILEEREAKREELIRHREEIRSRLNNEGKELEEREERREEMEELKEEMHMQREEIKEHMEERKEEMKMRKKEMKAHMAERKEEMKKHQKEMKEHRRTQIRMRQSGNWDHSDSESIMITKNTTDDQIKSITSELKSQGITFSLTKVKRNSKGEITSYKMKFNNNKGTESVSQKKSNNDSPIETLHIVYNDGNIQVHN
ncbi:M56 family metallopeptidase [Dokdonia sp.]|uniref:M56 family metallopeptidase n=1 Tax=Dokdonia sp. TaxID=2024995 RepID=UPI003263F06F